MSPRHDRHPPIGLIITALAEQFKPRGTHPFCIPGCLVRKKGEDGNLYLIAG